MDDYDDIATGPHRLDAVDKRALKMANRVVFSLFEGKANIRLVRDAESTTTGFEESREIPTGYYVRDYVHPIHNLDRSKYSAFEMFGSARFNDVWLSIRDRIVNARDPYLTLSWLRNNNNGYIDDAGLVRDELHLTIHPSSGKESTYLVAVSVCADNSARMIRLAGQWGLR